MFTFMLILHVNVASEMKPRKKPGVKKAGRPKRKANCLSLN